MSVVFTPRVGYVRTEIPQKTRNQLLSERVCFVCGNKKNLEIHHIVSIRNGGDSSMKNLMVLCECCHKKVHTGKVKEIFLHQQSIEKSMIIKPKCDKQLNHLIKPEIVVDSKRLNVLKQRLNEMYVINDSLIEQNKLLVSTNKYLYDKLKTEKSKSFFSRIFSK